MVTDTEDRKLDDEDSVMPTLIYPEDSNDKEYLSKPISADSTPEPGTPGGKPTKELTLEPDYDTLPEPSAPTREGFMGHLAPKDNYEILESVRSTHIFHSIRTYQGGYLGRRLKNMDFGKRQNPEVRRRPPKSYQEPISNTH